MPTQGDGPPSSVRADVLGDRGVFIWQKALRTPSITCRPPTEVRETLFSLALFMDADGTNGRPGNRRLSAPREVTERTLITHLQQAQERGWLICDERGRRTGRTSRASKYAAAFPREVYEALADLLCGVWGDCDGLPSQGAVHTGHKAHTPNSVPGAGSQGETCGLHLGTASQGEAAAVPNVKPGTPKVKDDQSQGETHGFHPTSHSHHSTPPLSRARRGDQPPPVDPKPKSEKSEREIDPLTQKLVDLHAAEGATADEAAKILDDIRREGKIRSLDAWAESQTGRLDFVRRLAELRNPPPPSALKTFERDITEALATAQALPRAEAVLQAAAAAQQRAADGALTKLRAEKGWTTGGHHRAADGFDQSRRPKKPRPAESAGERAHRLEAELAAKAAARAAAVGQAAPSFCPHCHELPTFCECALAREATRDPQPASLAISTRVIDEPPEPGADRKAG